MKRQNYGSYLATLLAILLFAPASFAGTIEGTVISVADGDTFTIQTEDGQEVMIRLAEIDSPEGDQPYSIDARKALADLIDGKVVRVKAHHRKDQFGRTIGRVDVGDLDVVEEMVRIGAAWVHRDYVTDRSLFALERDAKAAEKGLWGTTEAAAMPPWKWVG
jgi:micrococcal nuclease